jgi:hypothetical protein
MIDLWIESDTPGLYGNVRGASTDPTAETKVKIFWNTETGQITIISDHTCTTWGCFDARESCFECGEQNSVHVGEIETESYCKGVDCVFWGPQGPDYEWNGFSFAVDAAESFTTQWPQKLAALGIPDINRTISIGFHESGSGVFVASSGDTYPSMAVVQYGGAEPELLASMTETDLQNFPTGLVPDGNNDYMIVRDW